VALVKNCNLPDDLYYLVERHVWARRDDDGLVIVGMTDVAQNLAKTIISVTLKAAGKSVKKGRNVATVESGKWVGPVPAPVSGEIVEVNQELVGSPSLMNTDPYQAGWVAKIRAADWDADSADLVTGAEGLEAYQNFLEAEGIVCDG
jgi:glycine cleavage system H protein